MRGNTNLVDFFIVGAPKCGTTSLHKYLSLVQSIYLSQPKELNYFSCDDLLSSKLYYKDKVIRSREEYDNIFTEAPRYSLKGEASVSYLFYQNVPKKIKKYNKDAKILIVLRDPIERAFSHYLMDRRLGYCNLTFEDVFYNRSAHPLHFQQYFELGMYGKQISNYLSVFDNENVLVIKDCELSLEPNKTLNAVLNFLNISETVNFDSSIKSNQYKEPSNVFFKKLYSFHSVRRFSQILIPQKAQSEIKKLVFRNSSKPIISKEIKEELSIFYKNDLMTLSEILGFDFIEYWNI